MGARANGWWSWLARALPAVVGLFALVMATTAAQAERRLALVIGNGAYRHTGVLLNPPRDARLVAETLRQVGFEVTTLIDADAMAMKRAMLTFGRSLRGTDAVGLFYYAGHGLQVSGHNYLVPVGANITDETEAAIEAVSLSELLSTMDGAQSRVNIVVLDACRNNPFARSFRSGQQGLARVDAPTGSFVAYATAPGSVAADGAGTNSPYSAALARMLLRPGLAIEQVFKEVRREVLSESGGKQVPWDSSSLTGDFYFVPGSGPAAGTSRPRPPAPRPDDDKALDLALWNEIKGRNDPALLLSYLQQFPKGAFAEIARRRLIELKAVSAALADRAKTAPGPAQPPAGRSWREAIPGSSRREVGPRDLGRLDCDGLWVARNELFARNGYCFGSERGREVFGTAGCTTSDQGILSDLEKANMRAIKAEEDRRCPAGGASADNAAASATRELPRAQPMHFVSGLNPRGDNFLSLREAPGGREIGRLGPDTRLEVLGRQGSWLNVRLANGTTGWAFDKFVACCK